MKLANPRTAATENTAATVAPSLEAGIHCRKRLLLSALETCKLSVCVLHTLLVFKGLGLEGHDQTGK